MYFVKGFNEATAAESEQEKAANEPSKNGKFTICLITGSHWSIFFGTNPISSTQNSNPRFQRLGSFSFLVPLKWQSLTPQKICWSLSHGLWFKIPRLWSRPHPYDPWSVIRCYNRAKTRMFNNAVLEIFFLALLICPSSPSTLINNIAKLVGHLSK